METKVTKLLMDLNIPFTIHQFEYLVGGGTSRSSSELKIDEHQVVKSLIFQDERKSPLLVLMHGDRKVDLQLLAKQIGVTKIKSCSPDIAESWSGWPVGATNPFILKTPMKIYIEASIQRLNRIWINGGGRGILIELDPTALARILDFTDVNVAIDPTKQP
ncbi:MAG: Cys-tRNA(Pro) deacylase [Proteobacteria bacterium]|nr:Cys-tRNA(Pro) deacylase [Pseudomonadota bacterium]